MSAQRRRPARPGARDVAFDVLQSVRQDDAYANLLLPTLIERARLDTADAGLATELAYGALRMLGLYDLIIEDAARRTSDRIEPDLLDVLRLGCHQLLATRIPTHAAVNESVDLAARVVGRRATGFVNAVMRTISRSSHDEWVDRVTAGYSGAELLARRHSHPMWIIDVIHEALSAEGRADELEDALRADNAPPTVNFVVLPDLDAGEPKMHGAPDVFSPIGFESDGGDPTRLIENHGGRIRVQDEGSQLAALALSRARAIRPGEAWLDLCAGPGGKAALLAAEARSAGATLTSNEVVPARATLVRRALAAIPNAGAVVVADGRDIGSRHPGAYDRIMLDAPCSGLGALRRRPEARWRKQPGDVPELVALQYALLDSALDALAPGGVLAYVTCSPHLAEADGVVETVLAERATRPSHAEGSASTSSRRIEKMDTAAILERIALAPMDLAGSRERVQLWPHRHGTDAMSISLLLAT